MSRTLPLLPAALVAATLALGVANPASAATVGYDTDGTLVYTADDGEQNRTGPYPETTKDGYIRIPAGYGVTLRSFPQNCDDWIDNGNFVSCPKPPALRFVLGDGDDHYSSSTDMPADLPVTVDGGTGADELDGRDAHDTLLGGPGNDKLSGWTGNDHLDGGDGDDEISGWVGDDTVLGGTGNDMLHPDDLRAEIGHDVVDGGAGIDTIESDYWTGEAGQAQLPLAFTMAGGADDGRPGENDDVRGVERLILSGAATISGTEGPDFMKLHQVGGDGALTGLGGDDELRGGDGADKIDGGAGADIIDGGFGDDTITGGPGRDRISADQTTSECSYLWCKHPYGNDTVDARDGEADSIDCGAGQDTVRADAVDTVAPSCETVDKSAPVVAPGPGKPVARPRADGKAAAKVTVRGKVRLRTALRRGLTLSIKGLKKGAKVKVLHGRKTVARGTARRAGRVTVRFTRGAKRSLARKKTVRLTVVAKGVRQAVTLKR